MTTKRILIAIALLGVVIAAYFLWPRPPISIRPIPADKLVQDFDPETATPEEVRAQAWRVFDKMVPIVQDLPSDTNEQANAKDAAFQSLAILSGWLGDMVRAETLRDEIYDPNDWSRVTPTIAAFYSRTQQTEVIESLLDWTTDDDSTAHVLYFLTIARASSGDIEGAIKLVEDPRLMRSPTGRSDPHHKFHAIRHIVRAAADAGEHDRARLLTAQAEELYTQADIDPYEDRLVDWLVNMHFDARDLESALRLLNENEAIRYQHSSMREFDPFISHREQIAKLQAMNGDLQAAADTRELGSGYWLYELELYIQPAKELAASGKPELARQLLREGVEEMRANNQPTQALIRIASTQREMGFNSDAQGTIEAVLNESDDTSTLLRIAEFERAGGNLEAAKSRLQRISESPFTSEAPEVRSRILFELSGVYAELSDSKSVLQHLQTAIESAAEMENSRDKALLLSDIAGLQSDFDQTGARSTFGLALSTTEKLKDERAGLYAIIARQQVDSGLFQDALETVERTLKFDEETGVDLAKMICARLATSGRVTAAMAVADQVQVEFGKVVMLDLIASELADQAQEIEHGTAY